MEKKRNIWPYAIIGSFLVFAIFIGSMVKQAMDVSLNLESEDYYAQEVAYEDRINQMKNAKLFGIGIVEENGNAVLKVGKDNIPSLAHVHFYRPSDDKMDLKKNYEINEEEYVFNTSVLEKGKWFIRVELATQNGKAYVEKELIVK